MSNYRIIIEPTTEEVAKRLPEKLREGVECEGFVLLIDKADDHITAIQDIGRMDIASMIGNSAQLLACSHIAKAMHEAKDMERKCSISELLDDLTNKANR